jgi:hypothetical protein
VFKFLKNYRIMLGIALLLFIITMIFSARFYRQLSSSQVVIKATKDMTSGQQVTEDLLKPAENFGTLPADVVMQKDEIAGLYPKGFIPADTVLRKSMFQDKNSGIGIEGELKNLPGLWAVSFSADIYTTVGGNIVNGSSVVVYLIDTSETRSEKVGEGIKVLSAASQDSTQKSVTLALKPEQSDRVAECLARGCTFLFALQPRS